MFIEEVTKVNDMVYGHQAELKKPKYKDIDLWSTGWQKISVAVPPANNSTASIDDIKKIQQFHASRCLSRVSIDATIVGL